MMLDIPEDVAERLKALAQERDVDVADLLRELLNRHESEIRAKPKKVVTLADLGRNAEAFAKAVQRQDIEDSQQAGNTAANSRDILKEIYAEKFGPPK